jgi:hypothetical protein
LRIVTGNARIINPKRFTHDFKTFGVGGEE